MERELDKIALIRTVREYLQSNGLLEHHAVDIAIGIVSSSTRILDNLQSGHSPNSSSNQRGLVHELQQLVLLVLVLATLMGLDVLDLLPGHDN